MPHGQACSSGLASISLSLLHPKRVEMCRLFQACALVVLPLLKGEVARTLEDHQAIAYTGFAPSSEKITLLSRLNNTGANNVLEPKRVSYAPLARQSTKKLWSKQRGGRRSREVWRSPDRRSGPRSRAQKCLGPKGAQKRVNSNS